MMIMISAIILVTVKTLWTRVAHFTLTQLINVRMAENRQINAFKHFISTSTTVRSCSNKSIQKPQTRPNLWSFYLPSTLTHLRKTKTKLQWHIFPIYEQLWSIQNRLLHELTNTMHLYTYVINVLLYVL